MSRNGGLAMTASVVSPDLMSLQRALESQMIGEGDPNPITDMIAQAMSDTIGKFSRRPKWARLIESLDMQQVAHLSFIGVLDHVSDQGNIAQAHGVLSHMAKQLGMVLNHDRETLLQLSWNLLHLCREIGLVNIATTKRGEPTCVVSMSSVCKHMMEKHGLWSLCGITRRPMLVEPVPHTLDAPGGYYDERLRKGMANGVWDNVVGLPVIRSMNNVQRTPHMINIPVLEAAEFLLEPYMQAEQTNKYAIDGCLRTAREFEGRKFYDPTFCETRGRLGKCDDQISDMGNDLSKGLRLNFNGVEVHQRGLYWFSVEVANRCSGLPIADGLKLDKIPFDDRVQWVKDNLQTILTVADDPYSNRDLYWDGWERKAQTFQCLSGCIEMSKMLETGISHLPCRQDAGCNSYQWVAAYMRCRPTAERTNLVMVDGIRDFHTDVSDEVRRSWESGECDHDFAGVFMDNVDYLTSRSTAKDPSMVLGYGGTRRGISGRFLGPKTWHQGVVDGEEKWMIVGDPESVIGKVNGLEPEDHRPASWALAGDFEEAVNVVCPAAKQFTEFIRACVTAASDRGEPLSYVSPSGIRFFNHPYKKVEYNLTASSVFTEQTHTQLKFTTYGDELDKRKARTAAPPNFTHGNDAAHLHITSCWLEDRGVTDQSYVHDCYIASCNDMDLVREGFVTVFVHINQTSLLVPLSEEYGVELPDMGDLDINEVLNSQYALH